MKIFFALLAIATPCFGSLVPKENWISDFDTKLALGRIYSHQKTTHEKALSYYEQILLEKPAEIDIYIEAARLYIDLKRADVGLALLYQTLQTHPNHLKLLVATAQGEARIGHAEQSRDLFLRALSISCKNDTEIEYADAMMSWGSFHEAEVIYRKNDLPLKLAGALAAQGRDEEAGYIPKVDEEEKIFVTKSEELNEEAQKNLKQGDPEAAYTLYLEIIETDPDYFPAWIGLAEVLSIFERYDEALEIYQSLLEKFPDNSKIMIAIARVLGWSKHICASLDWYDQMIQLDPANPVLYKEKARTAIWGHDFKTATESYNTLLSFSDNAEIQYAIALEQKGKAEVWHRHPWHALRTYETLLEVKPKDEELLFDEAQINCSLGTCCRALNIYRHILEIDPNHTLVQKTLETWDYKMSPALRSYLSYWREIGSGTFSASQIARYRFDAIYEHPLCCSAAIRFIQHAWVENPFENFRFYPAAGQSIEVDGVIDEFMRGAASLTYKSYFRKFKPRVSTRNQLTYNCYDWFYATFGCNYDNEIYNFFSLKQGIQALNNWITLASNINHVWSVEGTFQNLNYSDNNNQVHLNFTTKLALTEDPALFQVILEGDYRNTVHETITIIVNNQTVDEIHPYWTPQRYFAGTFTLQYHYDYRDVITCESPQRYIDLKIRTGTDSVNNPLIAALLEWRHEYNCWGFEVKGMIQRSPQWKAEGFWGSMYYHF